MVQERPTGANEVGLSRRLATRGCEARLPNKRLKLAGAPVLKEAVVSCPGGHGLSSTSLAPAGGAPAALTRSRKRMDGLPSCLRPQVPLLQGNPKRWIGDFTILPSTSR